MITGTNPRTPLTIEQIISAFRSCDDEAPVAAIRAAITFGQEIVPALLEEIEESVTLSANGEVVPHDSHRIAVILLTAIDAKDALSEILEIFSADQVTDIPLFGTMLTDTLPHIIAQLNDDATTLIDDIENADVQPFLHRALVRGLFGMVVEGKLSREEAARLLLEQLEQPTVCQDRDLVANLLSTLTDLAAPGTADPILRAFDSHTVNTSVIDRSTCEAALTDADEHFRLRFEEFRRDRIDDPVEYFQRLPRGVAFGTPPENLDDAMLRLCDATMSADVASVVRWLRRHREEATPRLMQLLEDAATLRGHESDDEWMDSLRQDTAAVLLTEFEFKPALSAILKGVCHSDPDVVDRFRRVIDLYLDQAVGRLADRPDEIREHASDPTVDEDVRTELVDGIYWMMMEGKLTRDEAIEYLQSWLNQAIDESDVVLTTAIVWSLMDLCAKQTESDIRRAFTEDCVDENRICKEDVDDWLEDSVNSYEEEMTFRRICRRIENSVFEVRSWQVNDRSSLDGDDGDEDEFYDEDDEGDEDDHQIVSGGYPAGLDLNDPDDYQRGLEAVRRMSLVGPPRAEDLDMDDEELPPAVETIRMSEPKVGRNDPCPCGSGKKYKKCCLKFAT